MELPNLHQKYVFFQKIHSGKSAGISKLMADEKKWPRIQSSNKLYYYTI